jgi:hypothetical protein
MTSGSTVPNSVNRRCHCDHERRTNMADEKKPDDKKKGGRRKEETSDDNLTRKQQGTDQNRTLEKPNT